jgi:hypothetical protein
LWSFFSKDLYHEACHQWKGTGFAYLLLLLAVCWIAPVVKFHRGVARFVDNEASKIVSQIPAISIVNGKASTDKPQQYFIQNRGTGENLVVIDTTGAMTSLDDTKAVGLITKTHAIFKKNQIETRTFSFRDITQFSLDQAKITGWLALLKKYLAPILYPFAVLGSFIGRMIQLLVYAAIGVLISSWCREPRTYGQLLRLSVVAVTPCILIKTILGVAQIHIPTAGLWYFLCAMGFLIFGVKAAGRGTCPPALPAMAPGSLGG